MKSNAFDKHQANFFLFEDVDVDLFLLSFSMHFCKLVGAKWLATLVKLFGKPLPHHTDLFHQELDFMSKGCNKIIR